MSAWEARFNGVIRLISIVSLIVVSFSKESA